MLTSDQTEYYFGLLLVTIKYRRVGSYTFKNWVFSYVIDW